MENAFYIFLLIICLSGIVFYLYKIIRLANLPPEEKQKLNEIVEKQTQEAINKKTPRNENGQIKCPYCGSINFQMVSRRWSPLTGFFTNKVDRVCVSCKRRFWSRYVKIVFYPYRSVFLNIVIKPPHLRRLYL